MIWDIAMNTFDPYAESKIINFNKIKKLEIEISSVCNLKCPLCFRNNGFVKFDQKFADTKKLLDLISKFSNLEYICFAGQLGEPTLHPDFLEIVKRLSKYKLEFFINCETREDNFYRLFGVISRNNPINVTICGSTNEIHSHYRKQSNLKTVLKRYNILRKFNKNVILNWIVFKYNLEDYINNKTKFPHKRILTIPFQEFLNLKISDDFKFPNKLPDIDYTNNGKCDEESAVITVDLECYRCCCQRWNIPCWQCNPNNVKKFKELEIFNLPEHGVDFPYHL